MQLDNDAIAPHTMGFGDPEPNSHWIQAVFYHNFYQNTNTAEKALKPELFTILLCIMEHRTKIFENCTLLQACEWIAYKIPPMEQIRARARGFRRGVLLPDKSTGMLYEMVANGNLYITQYDKDYSENIWSAMDKLKLAIYDGSITVYGDISGYESAHKLLEIATTGKRPMLGSEPRIPEKKFVQIKDIPNTVSLNIETGVIKANGIEYTDVYIPFKDLKTVFHNAYAKTAFDDIETQYITPYMKIMVEVINEQKITAKNQPQKDTLKDIILKKLAERGIWSQGGKPSESLAGYMATIIRLPESQKGHA